MNVDPYKVKNPILTILLGLVITTTGAIHALTMAGPGADRSVTVAAAHAPTAVGSAADQSATEERAELREQRTASLRRAARDQERADALRAARAARRALLAKERASRSRRLALAKAHAKVAAPQGFEAWRTSSAAKAVSWCESKGNIRAVNPSGKYRGKWQMDRDFWSTYGGLQFASRPELASEREQDLVAYRGYLARGWQPWECRKAL